MKKTNKQKDEGGVKEMRRLAKELVKLMDVDAKVEVSEDKERETINVNLDTESEKGLLIGKKGETLYSLQYLLALMLNQKIGVWKRVEVNIGDWRERQDDYLKTLARKAAERAKETGEEQRLYNLNPAQRRIIHVEISTLDGVVSESEGEGDERCLVVRAES